MNNIKAPRGRGEAEKGKTRRHFFLSLENAKARAAKAYDRAQARGCNTPSVLHPLAPMVLAGFGMGSWGVHKGS